MTEAPMPRTKGLLLVLAREFAKAAAASAVLSLAVWVGLDRAPATMFLVLLLGGASVALLAAMAWSWALGIWAWQLNSLELYVPDGAYRQQWVDWANTEADRRAAEIVESEVRVRAEQRIAELFETGGIDQIIAEEVYRKLEEGRVAERRDVIQEVSKVLGGTITPEQHRLLSSIILDRRKAA